MAVKTYQEIARLANAAGWMVFQTWQRGDLKAPIWHVNLRRSNETGVNMANEFAEHHDLNVAMESAWFNAQARTALLDKGDSKPQATTASRSQTAFNDRQEKRLDKAMDAMWYALVVKNGTGSRDRKDDL